MKSHCRLDDGVFSVKLSLLDNFTLTLPIYVYEYVYIYIDRYTIIIHNNITDVIYFERMII